MTHDFDPISLYRSAQNATSGLSIQSIPGFFATIQSCLEFHSASLNAVVYFRMAAAA